MTTITTTLLAFGLLSAAVGFVGYCRRWHEHWLKDPGLCAAMACSTVFLTWSALAGRTVDPPIVAESTVHDSPIDGATVYRATVIEDTPYVGSSIKQVYHVRGCRYADLMAHQRWYESQEAAEADGKSPCKVCLPQGVAMRGK